MRQFDAGSGLVGEKGDFYDYATTDPGPIDFGDRLQGSVVWNWGLIGGLAVTVWAGVFAGVHGLKDWLK